MRELARISAAVDKAIELVSSSPLSASARARYGELLRARASVLAA